MVWGWGGIGVDLRFTASTGLMASSLTEMTVSDSKVSAEAAEVGRGALLASRRSWTVSMSSKLEKRPLVATAAMASKPDVLRLGRGLLVAAVAMASKPDVSKLEGGLLVAAVAMTSKPDVARLGAGLSLTAKSPS